MAPPAAAAFFSPERENNCRSHAAIAATPKAAVAPVATCRAASAPAARGYALPPSGAYCEAYRKGIQTMDAAGTGNWRQHSGGPAPSLSVMSAATEDPRVTPHAARNAPKTLSKTERNAPRWRKSGVIDLHCTRPHAHSHAHAPTGALRVRTGKRALRAGTGPALPRGGGGRSARSSRCGSPFRGRWPG